MKTILIAVSQGFQERLLVQSGIAAHLARGGARVVIAAPHADESNAERIENVTWVAFEPQPSRFNAYYYEARRLLLWRQPIEGALLNFQNVLEKKRPWLLRLVRLGRRLPWRALLMADGWCMRSRDAKNLLRQVQPDLVVTASPGFHYPDAVLLGEATRAGLRTAVVGQSWDNFSSKGYVNPKPDLMICWGEQMRREAIALQDFAPQKTIIAGAPHFDVYHNLARFGSREDVLRGLGFDPRRRLLVYGTSPRVLGGDEFDVVQRLAQWVEQSPGAGQFREPLQLLVRLHPQQVTGYYAEDLQAYRALQSERVKLDVPEIIESKIQWHLAPGDQERLPLILSHADVVLNCFSTFAIDAVAAGKPAICCAFDGDQERSEAESVRRYLKYTHLQGLISSGGVRVVHGYDELIAAVNDYLADPQRDAAGRARLIHMQVHRIDGQAAHNVAAALAKLAGATAPAAMPSPQLNGVSRENSREGTLTGARDTPL